MKTNQELYRKLNERVFPFVQKPVRYLGLEMGTVVKDIKNIPLKFALAFPDFYELGMSHIGMGIIYDILNSRDYIACERVYLPYPDMNLKLKENRIPLFSLESFEEIRAFDVVGFSLQYELSYTNILLMLEMSDIPIFSKDRTYDRPFIGAGGPCAFNPLPLNDFMDFFIIGDGEITAAAVCDTVLKAKKSLEGGLINKAKYRESVKSELAKIRGVYVPGYSKSVKKSIIHVLNDYDSCGGWDSGNNKDNRIKRGANYAGSHMVPLVETVHNRFSIEIARGCSSGCRFCQAGYIYRPVRERKKETIVKAVKNGLFGTGLEEISLSSLSTGDYSEIDGLLSELAVLTAGERISMSFPSMRIGSLSENILKKTAAVKKTNFTLAPEAGTQRLRDIINKNISEEDLLEEAAGMSKKGFKNLKLYFMLGLPYERIDDLDGIVRLASKIKRAAKGLRITVNVNNFVPKPHTPFQWHRMEKESELDFKINRLKESLRPLNVNFRYQDPKVSFIEGLISRGDNFTSKIIYRAYKFGAIYDSEPKLLNYGAWLKALGADGGECGRFNFNELTEKYLYAAQDVNSPLPWDFIDTLVDKEYLKSEFKKSHMQSLKQVCGYLVPPADVLNNSAYNTGAEFLTENCRKVCHLCGVCDFKTISPVYSSNSENIKMHKKRASGKKTSGASEDAADAGEKHNTDIHDLAELIFIYSKKEDMKYLGHLETVKILLRAFRIARLPIAYGESKFSPKPKISFSNPIPFMCESDDLYIKLKITKNGTADFLDGPEELSELKSKINGLLPCGIKVLDVKKNCRI